MLSMYRPHERRQLICDDPSRTRSEFKNECDVNALMKRYQKTGMFPQPVGRVPRYLDLTDVPDFHTAMQFMVEAEASFMSLPAAVRKEFDNSPQDFVAFAEKAENLPKLREWGLAPPEEAPPAPMQVEVVNPPLPEAGS